MEGGIIPVNEHSRNLCLVWLRNDVRSDSRGINASFLFRYYIIYIILFFFFFSVIVVKKNYDSNNNSNNDNNNNNLGNRLKTKLTTEQNIIIIANRMDLPA